MRRPETVKPSPSYLEFKFQCDAMRLYVFWIVTGGLTLDLIMRPLRSSYFLTWGPTHWPSNFLGLFSKDVNEVFLTAPVG